MMPFKLLKSITAAVCFVSLVGCVSDRVVLLPNADGSRSAVILKTSQGERVIDQPYEAASISGSGKIAASQETAASVQARYGEVLGAQPKRPASYLVYFSSGNNEITPDSQVAIEQMKADMRTRNAPQITVIGHTDRVGAMEVNDALSLTRARVIRDMLISDGIPPSQIEASGSGEREPLVPTEDEVDEPMNRRVEINVR